MKVNWYDALRAIPRYFQDLFAGDPVAWAFTLFFVALFGLFGLFWWRTSRALRREEEERKRKRYGGAKKPTDK